MDWLVGGLATVFVAAAGWVGALQGRLTKVEAQQVALKERLDGVEERICRQLDRIEDKLDNKADR